MGAAAIVFLSSRNSAAAQDQGDQPPVTDTIPVVVTDDERTDDLSERDELWTALLTAGAGGFSGDNIGDDPDFAAQARLRLALSEHSYLTGGTFYGRVAHQFEQEETFFKQIIRIDPNTGQIIIRNVQRTRIVQHEDESRINFISFGAGLRDEVSEDLDGYVEARLGPIFGGDVDTSLAAAVSAGLGLALNESGNARLVLDATGLFTDAEVGPQGELEFGWMVGLGIQIEF